MSIERKLSILTPISEPTGDRVPSVAQGVPYEGKISFAAETERTEPKQVGHMRTFDEARVDNGNDWQGFPQLHPEIRAEARTAIGYLDVSGAISIDLSLATIFRLEIVGDTTISLTTANWPSDVYDRTSDDDSGVGLEFGVVLMIDNTGGHNLTIAADHWAPKDIAPDLSNAGYYEIGLAVNWMPGWPTLVRGFPAITPMVEE